MKSFKSYSGIGNVINCYVILYAKDSEKMILNSVRGRDARILLFFQKNISCKCIVGNFVAYVNYFDKTIVLV